MTGCLCNKYARQEAELRLQGSIYAVLWNKYPVMDRLLKPSE